MKEQTLEEVYKKGHQITMKDLRKFVKNNIHLDDSIPVLIERVEDEYFENNNWDIYLNEGYHYESMVEFNKSMDEEQERIDKGLERLYPDTLDPKYSKWDDEDLKSFKEQFYSGHCISKNKQENLILIYSHY